MKTLIIGLIIILLVGGIIYMYNKKNNTSTNEAPLAAGMNFDFDEVEPFLNHLTSTVLDSGFSQEEINTIQSEIESMEHNEVKEIGTFNVIYKGKPAKIRIEAEVHFEDVEKEVVLYMYSIQELVDIIDEEMMKTEEEREF